MTRDRQETTRMSERRVLGEERRATAQAAGAIEHRGREQVLAAVMAIRLVLDRMGAEQRAVQEDLRRLRASRQCSHAYARAGKLGQGGVA